jgi:hypothetical protein
MTTTRLPALFALLAAVLGAGCGGSQESQAPLPLETAQAPATLEEAFAQAPADARAEALEAASLMKAGDYSLALVVLQNLCARPELTGDQRTLATRSLLTAQQEVAKAADSGNEDARKLLRYRSLTK